MDITCHKNNISTLAVDAVVFYIESQKVAEGVASSLRAHLDDACGAYFDDAEVSKHLPVKAGDFRVFYGVTGVAAGAVVVAAVDATQKSFSSVVTATTGYLAQQGFTDVAVSFPNQEVKGFAELGQQKTARLLAQGLANADYHFNDFKSDAEAPVHLSVQIVVSADAADEEELIAAGMTEGLAIAKGMHVLRDLGNLPGNVCTPTYLGELALTMAERYPSLTAEVLQEEELAAMKMGSLLSVSKGSIEPPRLITLQHKGSDDAPIVFVGKGVTFDSGGISLKPGAGMDEMKYDMCGAGAVFGIMHTIAELNLPINVVGIVPSVENMPSDRASKPGDIVTSMSGKTIEILNTDAEGRLILCDALTYAQQKFEPKALIDMATLTGAVIVALGRHASGVMSNSDDLAQALVEAGEQSGDRAWRLPVWDEYTEQLKSPFADLQNIGTPGAGTITAGCFLAEFVGDVPWAHIDIAGTAWQNRTDGATGRPVPLLADYLFAQLD